VEKRVVIAIGLCIGILILWTQLFPPPVPEKPPAAPPAPAPTAPAAPTAQPGGTPGAPAAAPGTGTASPGAPAVDRPETLVELSTPEVRFVFSSRGGTLVHAQLKEKQFQEKKQKDAPPVPHDVVRATDAADAPLRIAFPAGIPTPADGAWETSQPTPDAVVFAADAGNVHIEKRFRLDKARYRLQMDVVVANRGETAVGSTLLLSIGGRQDPDSRGGGFFSGVSANVSSALCFVNGDLKRQSIEGLAKDPISEKDGTGAVNWIATDEKFFVLAAVPYPDPPPAQPRTCATRATGTDAGQITLRFAERAVAPKAEAIYPFLVFAGPKVTDELEAVQPMVVPAPGAAAVPVVVNLEQSVDVTLAILARPILSLLKIFHRFAHNWGLAIVLLTLFIKTLTFYPTQKSLVSAKRMQKLAPKMAAIRKKYENDRQRQSVETMNLYKAHGVSPFGGCLPSLIQMPIWIALYSTLNYAVELYQAPFIFHIHDLTAKDPFYVTPLVMGGVMFAQMKMSPAGADPQQQAMMSVLMPIMFTGFSLFLPSGLAVYMLTSYLFGIVQQLYVNYLDRKGKITV
jgi:YidC/Oxa1 family membrane protein insertase